MKFIRSNCKQSITTLSLLVGTTVVFQTNTADNSTSAAFARVSFKIKIYTMMIMVAFV